MASFIRFILFTSMSISLTLYPSNVIGAPQFPLNGYLVVGADVSDLSLSDERSVSSSEEVLLIPLGKRLKRQEISTNNTEPPTMQVEDSKEENIDKSNLEIPTPKVVVPTEVITNGEGNLNVTVRFKRDDSLDSDDYGNFSTIGTNFLKTFVGYARDWTNVGRNWIIGMAKLGKHFTTYDPVAAQEPQSVSVLTRSY